jgi:hypothetical protein
MEDLGINMRDLLTPSHDAPATMNRLRALCRSEKHTLAHCFSFERVRVRPRIWLPLMPSEPVPEVLITTHHVLDPDAGDDTTPLLHCCVLNLAIMTFFVGPTHVRDENRRNFVEGCVRIEPEDIQEGEAHFAAHMRLQYKLGPPLEAFRLMVNVYDVARTNFHDPDAYKDMQRVVRKRPSSAKRAQIRAKRARVD